jgi:phosphoglycolate phosphatase
MNGPAAGLVVFDLDGTLVDSATDLASAVSALAEELGGRLLTRTEVIGMVGEGAAVLVRRALTAAGVDPATPGATARFLALYDARLLATTCLYPGVRDVLDALDPRTALAVLTNKPAAPAERLLSGLGVRQYFIEVVGGDGPWPRKPDPAGLTALRVHARGGPMVMVGDSPVDAETAARAGATFVLARYGFGASAFGDRVVTPFVVEAPQMLADVIRRAMGAARSID